MNKEYTIPVFSQDTIRKSFTIKEFEELNILPPITKSRYSFELRGYYEVAAPAMGSAVVIKGNKDTLCAEAYYYYMQRDKADTIAPKGFSIIKWNKRNIYYSVKSVEVSDTLLTSLIKNKLFEVPDIDSISKDLKNRHITVKAVTAFDPYYMSFELKVLNNYRSFYCEPFMAAANQNAKELLPEKRLFEQFDKLYNQSGQVANHLFP